jgi:hypothetical protein
MSGKQYYAGLIWTNHALERLGQRGLSQELASQAFHSPDKVIRGNSNGSVEYQKRVQQSLVTTIVKQNEHNEWIVLSCWINPPLPGTEDEKRHKNYKRYQRAGFWGKVVLEILRQLGLVKY